MRNRFAEFESFLGADDEFFFLHGAKGASVSELAMGWDRADWVGRGGDAGSSIPLSSARRIAEVICRRCRPGYVMALAGRIFWSRLFRHHQQIFSVHLLTERDCELLDATILLGTD